MKLLSIAYLFAGAVVASSIAATTAHAAARSNICPTGELTNSHNTIGLNAPGTTYYAEGCKVGQGSLVNYYAQEAPRLSGNLTQPGADTRSQRITASFNNGNFHYNSQILVCMPLADAAATTVPIHVYVQNNYFNTNAVIRFYGSYPKNSKIVITGNKLETVTEPSLYPTMTTQLAGILGWQSNKDIYMKENSHIEISNNDVYVMATDSKYEVRGIGIWNYVYMQANCSVSINNNLVRARGNQGKFNGGIDAFAYIAEGENTHYEMINNTVNVWNGFAIGCPYARYPNTAAEEMRFPTQVLVSRNSGTINKAVYFPTSKSDGDVIYVGNSKNSLTSQIEISYNKFKVDGSDGNIRVAQTELLDTATVRVQNNELTTNGGNPRLIFSWNMSAYDDSRVYVTHNDLKRTDAFDFYPGSFFLYYRGYNLYNRSESHYSHNTFTAQGAARKAYFLDRYPEMPFFVHSDSAFKVCDNDYYGKKLDTDEKLNETVPAYVSPYMASMNTCPSQPIASPPLPAIPATARLFNPLSNDPDNEAETTAPAVTSQQSTAPTPIPTPSGNNTEFGNGCVTHHMLMHSILAVFVVAVMAAL